jgi:hypothetical protein
MAAPYGAPLENRTLCSPVQGPYLLLEQIAHHSHDTYRKNKHNNVFGPMFITHIFFIRKKEDNNADIVVKLSFMKIDINEMLFFLMSS